MFHNLVQYVERYGAVSQYLLMISRKIKTRSQSCLGSSAQLMHLQTSKLIGQGLGWHIHRVAQSLRKDLSIGQNGVFPHESPSLCHSPAHGVEPGINNQAAAKY